MAYFRTLKEFRYGIPGAAKPIFQRLIGHLRRRRDGTCRILDLGCSYGVNSALLKHDLSMSALYDHWGTPEQAAGITFEVASIRGGDKHNAIPREADAVLYLEPSAREAFAKTVACELEGFRSELGSRLLGERPRTGFASVEDLARRTGFERSILGRLAESGAFCSLRGDRRDARPADHRALG